ncbi:MAG: hypothetical protein COV70_03815 [Parcubacteria group bacterium CG11_big_fil_rev_8_21_14_0_20_39_22]|nr:MAG: hypothetical protein COV70_03815 [Parcubacteria group bacterium CG11_big_fil_rev_8_21_14_0_20_39_22]
MTGLRSKEAEEEYREHKENGGLSKGCPLCSEKILKEFKHWKILKNRFPYDRIAQDHDMIVSMRHVKEGELTDEEFIELREIKNNFVFDSYQYVIESSMKQKSIPEHFHLHLVNTKD